jgi:hypothetical protein
MRGYLVEAEGDVRERRKAGASGERPMRKMNVIVLTIGALVVLVGAAGWFACTGWKSVGIVYLDDVSSATGIDEIRVTGKTVAVEVRTGTGPGVQIHRTARYLNPLHARPDATHRIAGTVLELGGDNSASFGVIEYVVHAPAGLRITADIGTGSIDVAGVSTVDARIGTGSLTITGATGDVTARVNTGSITASGLSSDDVVATAGTGSVSVGLAVAADVEARTGTGSVDVTVPADAYRVEASTGMGDLKLGIPNDANGEHRIALRSNMGRVTLATN